MNEPIGTLSEWFQLRTSGLSWTPAESEIIVLDLRTSEYLSSNESGKVLWERLSSGATVEDLAHALMTAFGIEARIAQRDSQAFVDDLIARTLVELRH